MPRKPKDDKPKPNQKAYTICHLNDDGAFVEKQVNGHSLSAHLSHGDVYPDPVTGLCPIPDEVVTSTVVEE